MSMIASGSQLQPAGQPGLVTGHWRVDPDQSRVLFAARVAGQPVHGHLPMTGWAEIAEPIEGSTAELAALTSAVSTGSAVLDRVLAGPGFLDAANFPEIRFRAELLVQVPSGWRAVGHLRIRDAEHELACLLTVRPGEPQPGGPACFILASTWVLDARWVTSHWVPGLSRRIAMTSCARLEPGS